MDDSIRNMIIGSIVLVLASMYGGDTLGSWFHWKHGTDYNDGDTAETTLEFYLKEYKVEGEFDAGPDSSFSDDDYDEDLDYDDNECAITTDCDELEDLMQGKIKNMLYIAILAGFVALYFLNDGDKENGATACLVMGGAGLIAVLMFALSFPEALDDDLDAFEDPSDGFDEDPSLFGDDKQTSDSNIEDERSWRPGLAFALVTLSGIIGMAAYAELKN